jgi:hypothetical protein
MMFMVYSHRRAVNTLLNFPKLLWSQVHTELQGSLENVLKRERLMLMALVVSFQFESY